MPSVVDLFCGAGGLTHGFIKEGLDVVAGIDADATCRYPYETNNPGTTFHELDVREITPEFVTSLYPQDDIKILVGCAPCQPFSTYANRKAVDGRWTLLYKFAELITEVEPTIVSMENVPDLANHAIFKKFKQMLESEGYTVWWDRVSCADYGVPQTRVRLVLIASRLGECPLIKPTHANRHKTVEDVIGRLEQLNAGQASERDFLHRASALSDLNLRRIRLSQPGGTWRDWPEELRLDCHKKASGESYSSVYGRMRWNYPAPTMTTQCNGIGNGRFGHPDQDRAITLREAAIFQTFPKSYKFFPPKEIPNLTVVARHIGNAVPVRLGKVIARSIRRHLENHNA